MRLSCRRSSVIRVAGRKAIPRLPGFTFSVYKVTTNLENKTLAADFAKVEDLQFACCTYRPKLISH
jgi:hypothetical protein